MMLPMQFGIYLSLNEFPNLKACGLTLSSFVWHKIILIHFFPKIITQAYKKSIKCFIINSLYLHLIMESILFL